MKFFDETGTVKEGVELPNCFDEEKLKELARLCENGAELLLLKEAYFVELDFLFSNWYLKKRYGMKL